MSSSRTTRPPAAFVCDCDPKVRSACEGLPFFEEHEGKRYCVLHYPVKDKAAAFNKELKRKLEARDFNFRGVWFPDDVDFSGVKFTTPARFRSAAFNAGAYFRHATFEAAADFNSATFGAKTSFNSATFSEEADFTSATFDAITYFNSSVFESSVNFLGATFKDYVTFSGTEKKEIFGDGCSLNLQFAVIETPERLAFHTLTLRPHWFVNVDVRKFEFTNVKWNWRDINTRQEVKCIDAGGDLSAHRLLAVACRSLAVNAEENHRYEEASRFRYMAMEARRLERWRGYAFWTLDWWYWLASGYGERILRALVVFVLIWLAFVLLYSSMRRCGADTCERVDCLCWAVPQKAGGSAGGSGDPQPAAAHQPGSVSHGFPFWVVYTLETMMLQKPEPRPENTTARLAVLLCTVLGPLQAALLALAIRRKFMR